MDGQQPQGTNGSLVNVSPPIYNIGSSYANRGTAAIYASAHPVLNASIQGGHPSPAAAIIISPPQTGAVSHLVPHHPTPAGMMPSLPQGGLNPAQMYYPLAVSSAGNTAVSGQVYMNTALSAMYHAPPLPPGTYVTSPFSTINGVPMLTFGPMHHFQQMPSTSSGAPDVQATPQVHPNFHIQKPSNGADVASPQTEDPSADAIINSMASMHLQSGQAATGNQPSSGRLGATYYNNFTPPRRSADDLPGDPREPLYQEILLEEFKKGHVPADMQHETLPRDGILPSGECFSHVGSVKVFLFSCKEHYISHYVNYYFTRENLLRDSFTSQKLRDNQGVIYLADLAQYPKLRAVNTTEADVLTALRNSGRVELVSGMEGRICARRRDFWFPDSDGSSSSAAPSPASTSAGMEGGKGGGQEVVTGDNTFTYVSPAVSGTSFYTPAQEPPQSVPPQHGHRPPLLPSHTYPGGSQAGSQFGMVDANGRYLRQTFASFPSQLMASYSASSEGENTQWMLTPQGQPQTLPGYPPAIHGVSYGVPHPQAAAAAAAAQGNHQGGVWPFGGYTQQTSSSDTLSSSNTSHMSHSSQSGTPSPYFGRNAASTHPSAGVYMATSGGAVSFNMPSGASAVLTAASAGVE